MISTIVGYIEASDKTRKINFTYECGKSESKDFKSYLTLSLFAAFFIETIDAKYIFEKENAISVLRRVCEERGIRSAMLKRIEYTEEILKLLHSQENFRQKEVIRALEKYE